MGQNMWNRGGGGNLKYGTGVERAQQLWTWVERAQQLWTGVARGPTNKEYGCGRKGQGKVTWNRDEEGREGGEDYQTWNWG